MKASSRCRETTPRPIAIRTIPLLKQNESQHLQQSRELAISIRYMRAASRRQRLDHVPESAEAFVDLSSLLRVRFICVMSRREEKNGRATGSVPLSRRREKPASFAMITSSVEESLLRDTYVHAATLTTAATNRMKVGARNNRRIFPTLALPAQQTRQMNGSLPSLPLLSLTQLRITLLKTHNPILRTAIYDPFLISSAP